MSELDQRPANDRKPPADSAAAPGQPRIVFDERAWRQAADRLIAEHFDAAHRRADAVYLQRFASLGGVLHRHWRHKRDIPRDLANIPRALWQLTARLAGSPVDKGPATLSGKELAIAECIMQEVLQLHRLERELIALVRQYAQVDTEQWRELERIFEDYTPEQARQRVDQALGRLTVTQQGSRDALIFLTLGLVGRSLTDKVVFGSAIGLGSTAATSFYLSQQSFFGVLWAKWFGLPGWVSLSGAVGGFATLLIVTPIVAPLVECGVNRLRARSLLHGIVDRVQENLSRSGPDVASVAGHIGSYLQLLPDLIQVLRTLR